MPVTYRPDAGLANGGFAFGPTPLGSYEGLVDKGEEFLEPGRKAQLDALAQMREVAAGRGGPSVAQTQLRQSADRSALMGLNQAAMTRGGNLAGATQNATALSAGLGAQAGQQAAQLRAAEQAQAQQDYASLATQLSQQGMGYDSMAQDTLLQGTGLEQDWRLGNRELDIEHEKMMKDWYGGWADRGFKLFGSALSALSDERAKDNTQGSSLSASEAVGEVPAVTYEYKPGYGAPGERVGVIAQDVERVRPELVMETPYGKALDVGGIASLSLAASSEQEQRIRGLESALAALGGQPGAGAPGEPVLALSDERAKTINPFGDDDEKAQRMEDAGSALSSIGGSLQAAGGAEPSGRGGGVLDKLAARRRDRISRGLGGGGLAMMSDVRSKRAVGY